MKGVRVVTDLSTNEDWWEWGVSVDMDLMENIGPEWSDKEGRVVVKLIKAGNEPEEVSVDEFFLWYPDFLTVFIDYRILVRVLVNDTGAEWGCEEVWEVVIVDADGFFRKSSKSRTRSRRTRRRNMMNWRKKDWRG